MRAEGCKVFTNQFTMALLARDKTGMRLLHGTSRVALVLLDRNRYYWNNYQVDAADTEPAQAVLPGGGRRADKLGPRQGAAGGVPGPGRGGRAQCGLGQGRVGG